MRRNNRRRKNYNIKDVNTAAKMSPLNTAVGAGLVGGSVGGALALATHASLESSPYASYARPAALSFLLLASGITGVATLSTMIDRRGYMVSTIENRFRKQYPNVSDKTIHKAAVKRYHLIIKLMRQRQKLMRKKEKLYELKNKQRQKMLEAREKGVNT